jgi:hypothetical protein
MNKLTLAVSLLVTILLSQNAAADSRHGRQGWNNSRADGNHFRSYNRSHNRGFDRRGNRNYSRAAANPYHYGRAGNRRGNDFVSISYGNGFYNSGVDTRFDRRFGHGYNNRFNHRSNNNFYNNGYRNRWDRNQNDSNFVGGLVLGSLLSQQNYSSQSYESVSYRSAPVIVKRNVVYVNSTTRSIVSATPKRRLLRDLRGDCYDIEISPNGDELRSQIDPASCDF